MQKKGYNGRLGRSPGKPHGKDKICSKLWVNLNIT